MTTTTRKFGVEIEGFGISKDAVETALRNAGFQVYQMGYTHRTTDHWKIVHDGSVHGGNGWEVVSPILQGEEGLNAVIRVAEALDRAGAKVDRSCGLHVHVDAAGLTPSEVLLLVQRYARYETQIDAFMPTSRRGSNNYYCRTMANYERNLGPTDRGMTTFLRNVGARDVGELRYHKVNLHAFVRHGTVEFRHHSGTRNAQKIRNWILFVLHFVETTLELHRNRGEVSRAQAARQAQVTRLAQAPVRIVPVSAPETNTRAYIQTPARATDVPGYWSLTESQRAMIDRLYQGPATILELRQVWGGRGTSMMTEISAVSYISDIRTRTGLDIRKRRGGSYYLPDLATTPAGFARPRRSRQPQHTPCPTAQVQFIPAAEDPIQIPETIEDTLWRGVPADVVSFYEERAQEFAC